MTRLHFLTHAHHRRNLWLYLSTKCATLGNNHKNRASSCERVYSVHRAEEEAVTRMSHRRSRSAKSSLGVIGSTVADAEATEATGAPSTPIEAVDAATEGGMEMPLEILRDTSVVALLENVLEEVVDLVSGRVLATYNERERAKSALVVYKGVDANSKDADGAFESDCRDLSLDLVGYNEFEDDAAKVNSTTMAPTTSPKTTAALRRWNAMIW